MPEGPEILFFATFLKKKFINYKITQIQSFTDKPIILPEDFDGTILDIDSKGKLFWFKLASKSNPNPNPYYMHVHFGISGWILFKDPEKNVKYQFTLKKNKEHNLYLEDKIRLSRVQIHDESAHNEIINKLGIDIFTSKFTESYFKTQIKKKKSLLATFLLKQEIFSGIGNYIKNEILYMGKLKETIKTSELTDEQITQLYNNILFVAYSNLIEQLRDNHVENYLDQNKKVNLPDIIEIPYEYKIYGKKITINGEKVKKIKVGGRDTYIIEN